MNQPIYQSKPTLASQASKQASIFLTLIIMASATHTTQRSVNLTHVHAKHVLLVLLFTLHKEELGFYRSLVIRQKATDHSLVQFYSKL